MVVNSIATTPLLASQVVTDLHMHFNCLNISSNMSIICVSLCCKIYDIAGEKISLCRTQNCTLYKTLLMLVSVITTIMNCILPLCG